MIYFCTTKNQLTYNSQPEDLSAIEGSVLSRQVVILMAQWVFYQEVLTYFH